MSEPKRASQSDVPTSNARLLGWVDEMARLTKPDRVYWCDGSLAEKERLTAEAVERGILIPLNPEKRPGCYLHRSSPTDVIRTLCAPSFASEYIRVTSVPGGPSM